MKWQTKRTATKWCIKFPADMYAMDVEFDKPTNERQVREYARKFDGCERLPNGFACWAVDNFYKGE